MRENLAPETYRLKRELESFQNRAYAVEHGGVTDADLSAMEGMRARIEENERELGGKVFRVPVENLPELKSRVAKVAKRAVKLGVAPVELVEADTEMVERKRLKPDAHERGLTGDDAHETYFVEFRYVLVAGETPRVAGFEFVATLEHEEAGTILRRTPRWQGTPLDLSPYQHASPEHCDHCGFVRNRRDTYVVYNADTGELRQVGRTCLRDYTGAHNPEAFARMAEYLRDFLDDLSAWGEDEGFGGEMRGERWYSLRDFLANTSAMIRQNGWLSRTAAAQLHGPGSVATADEAWENMVTKKRSEKVPVEEVDFEKADAVLDWLRSDEYEAKMAPTETSDYLWNLHVATQRDFVNHRKAGLVASAVSAYDREREWLVRRELERKRQGDAVFVGEPGKRSDFVLTLTRTVWVEDYYSYNGGSKPLYLFADPDGNSVKWFSSRDVGLEDGVTYNVTATVKSHEEHPEYGKQTMVTRAKVHGALGQKTPEELGVYGECEGHPAGPEDPMGETVYCNGSCRSMLTL